MSRISFIGGGRITRIICRGLSHAAPLPSTVVYDNSDDALSVIKSAEMGILTTKRIEDALDAEIIILALHPAALPEILKAVTGKIPADTIVLSLTPKISIHITQELLAGHSLVARMNPNAPSIIGKGFNPIAFSPDFEDEKKAALLRLLAPLGKSPIVDDTLIESFAVITAMGPTYLDYQINLLKEMAAEFGIPENLAHEGIVSMTEGTAESVFTDLHGENPFDLIPVRPLKEIEEQVTNIYRTRLHEKFAMLTK